MIGSYLWSLGTANDRLVAILAGVLVLVVLGSAVVSWWRYRTVVRRPGYIYDRDDDRIGL